ncbi:hypothetical protein [Burkholderia stagnalis]|nr:hypothetical protein [Burkholderia stagnalis]
MQRQMKPGAGSQAMPGQSSASGYPRPGGAAGDEERAPGSATGGVGAGGHAGASGN